MKRLISFLFVLLVSLGLFSCKQNRQAEETDTEAVQSGKLAFMADYNGQYPKDVNFLQNEVLAERLINLIGSEYDFVVENWQTEAPIEVEDGMLYAWGMKAHSGGYPSAIVMIDLNKDLVYLAMKTDEIKAIYAEDDTDIPQRMIDWINEE